MKFRAMKLCLGSLSLLCALCATALNAVALDREAFSITNYDLNVQVDPEQHRLGVRGKITLRNDSATPQKIAVLQISSSLDWRAIKAGDKPVQFVTQPFTSDIDHTGGLSEAIITLPQPVAPKGTIELEIGYEGVIVLDATRLTRIGTPETEAEHSDWDQIVRDFVAVRGAGHVAWYPIATEAANLSEGDMFEVLGRWKLRETGARMQFDLSASRLSGDGPEERLIDRTACPDLQEQSSSQLVAPVKCTCQASGATSPTIVIAEYSVLERPGIEIHSLRWHNENSVKFADKADEAAPLIRDWFGVHREKVKVLDLPGEDDTPFESGSLLLMPLTGGPLVGLAVAHQLTHASFVSSRSWINEGLAHFAQALYLEHEKNRQAALDYMGLHRSAFLQAEQSLPPSEEKTRALVNTTSEELYRSKAMCVWWMLRDMIGDAALKKAIAAYKPEQDNDPSYMPRLIAAQTERDLGWFFDDWVYRDRGLPDFKIESVYASKTATQTYMVTVTIDNLGTAGAEVPVIVKSAGADVVRRVEVRAKSKAVIRVEAPARPAEVVVNDGSVPESDLSNNVFRVPSE